MGKKKIEVQMHPEGVRAKEISDEMTYVDSETGETMKISYSQELQMKMIERLENIAINLETLNKSLSWLLLFAMFIVALIGYGLISEGFIY